MKQISLSIFLVLFAYSCFAQGENLIKNGGFEEYHGQRGCRHNLEEATHWINPTSDTPDCMTSLQETACTANNSFEIGVPQNWLGYQYPHSGNGYMAMHTYTTNGDYQEYARSILDEPLYPGQTYTFTMYVIHANEQRFYTNGLGVHLSERADDSSGNNIYVKPNFHIEEVIYPSTAWKEYTWTFVADASYRSVTIGRFFRNSSEQFVVVDGMPDIPLPSSSQRASYYIDDISLVAAPVPKLELGEDLKVCDESLLKSPMEGESYSWSTGSDQAAVRITESGEYWLEVSRFGEIRRDTIEVAIINDYSVFPNPTNGDIVLEVASDKEISSEFQLFDSSGRLVSSEEIQFTQGASSYPFDFRSLASGIYLLRFTTPCGELVIKKIAVAKS